MSVPLDLLEAARQVRGSAYAPYSGFAVGAALRTREGSIFVGCNVENAAYPEGVCAEAAAIVAMVAAGQRAITEIVVVGGEGDDICMPCGGCRQKLQEFGTAETKVHACTADGQTQQSFTLAQVFPFAFRLDDLSDPAV